MMATWRQLPAVSSSTCVSPNMSLLAVDVGTTNCKAALFNDEGQLQAYASQPTGTRQTRAGYAYDPDELWRQVATAMRAVSAESEGAIAAIGISSMAETGLLLERKSGIPRTLFLPWFDRRTVPQAELLRQAYDEEQRFYHTGLRSNYKWGVAKLLWLKEQQPEIGSGTVWLSVADYVTYRLTGTFATDFSLATRTYAFRIDEKEWDEAWLRSLGLAPSLFPPALPAGEVVGRTESAVSREVGVLQGTPVTIAGHDHVCAAFASGAIQAGAAFDSMGTAEALVGAVGERKLTRDDYASGLLYGRHVARDQLYWMGGLSTSGGSVEWLRGLLAQPNLTYEALFELLEQAGPGPTGILYFPYLAGSGSPHSDAKVGAAFVGLRSEHGRGQLIKGVLEGVAFEMEWIRQAAAKAGGRSIDHIVAGGGGTRNKAWLQIKADVSGQPLHVLDTAEVSLLGAALLAGLSCGIYQSEEQAVSLPALSAATVVEPDRGRHQAYQAIFEEGYCRLQEPLRQTAARLFSS